MSKIPTITMKVVILAGGFGTRISEMTTLKPKPLIEIGGMPLLLHIIKIYSFYGINDFVVCCGYKGDMIKEYFANYCTKNSDMNLDFKNDITEIYKKSDGSWNLTLVDTGLNTMTGGRLKRVRNYVEDDTFCLTYGDDLKNVNITELINFHRNKKRLATLTAVHLPERYGILDIENDMVINFKEKPASNDKWINGGYYVLEPEALDYIKDDLTMWEREPLEKLSNEGQLSAFRYSGLYHPLDTLQDKNNLEELWNSGKAHWKVWK